MELYVKGKKAVAGMSVYTAFGNRCGVLKSWQQPSENSEHGAVEVEFAGGRVISYVPQAIYGRFVNEASFIKQEYLFKTPQISPLGNLIYEGYALALELKKILPENQELSQLIETLKTASEIEVQINRKKLDEAERFI